MTWRRAMDGEGRAPARLFGGHVAGELLRIPLDRIDPRPDQPRQVFDAGSLDELAQSLRDRGVLQPVRVRRRGERFEIIAGERRWRAARIAGLRDVPAILVEADDDEAYIEALVENIQREDLNAVDRAHALRRLRETLNLQSWAEVGRRIGIGRVHVHRLLNVTTLPEAMQDDVRAGNIGEKHARALALLRTRPARQLELWERIHERRLSGDAALREARHLGVLDSAEPDRRDHADAEPLRRAVEQMRAALAGAPTGAVLRLRADLATLRDRIDEALGTAPVEATWAAASSTSEPDGRGPADLATAAMDPAAPLTLAVAANLR